MVLPACRIWGDGLPRGNFEAVHEEVRVGGLPAEGADLSPTEAEEGEDDDEEDEEDEVQRRMRQMSSRDCSAWPSPTSQTTQPTYDWYAFAGASLAPGGATVQRHPMCSISFQKRTRQKNSRGHP